MAFVRRYFWVLVGLAAAALVASLVFRAGQPAALAGVILGGLLMIQAGRDHPAPSLFGRRE